MNSNDISIKVEATEILSKDVKDSGEAGAIYVPKEFIGKKVYVIIRR